MSWNDFYASLAELESDDGFATGRPGGLSNDMADRIAADIAEKLDLASSDSLLDYGAGIGFITRRLARHVRTATAAEETSAAVKRGETAGDAIRWVKIGPGSAPESASFDKVLSYYNAQAFSTHTEVRTHVEALCAAVAPGGTVMFGDVPDLERTGQWQSGERGREENRTVWMGRLERRALDIERDERNMSAFMDRLRNLGIEPPTGFGERHTGFERDIVSRMFRENGGKVTVHSQPLDFPNAHTCLDYIVHFE